MDRDPEVVRFIAGPWSDAGAHKAFIELRTLGQYPSGQGYWTIRSKSPPMRFLGWVLLIPLDTIGPEIEIGWRLCREAWGSGFATEAARAVLAHAFATLNLAGLVADIHPDNTRSIRVAKKLGLVLRRSRQHHGVAHLRYEISRAEFGAA